PLVVSHPLCRKVTGVNVRHSETFDTFVQALRQKRQRLRVLFIASDADSLSSNQEIAELQTLIEGKALEGKLQVDCELLPAERAIWYARKQIYGNAGTDETWTSPILVAQNPYR